MTSLDDRRAALGALAVSRETAALLDAYVALVRRWQPVRNLVARSTLDTIWTRHILDCAQLAPLVPDGATRIVDLGAGAGFPGLVLAILLRDRPGLHVTLVDSDHRKAAFLRMAGRELRLACTVRAERIEAAVAAIGRCDVVTARALAPLSTLLPWAAPLLKTGALGLFMKGERLAAELTESRALDTYDVDVTPSRTQSGSAIIQIRSRDRDMPA